MYAYGASRKTSLESCWMKDVCSVASTNPIIATVAWSPSIYGISEAL